MIVTISAPLFLVVGCVGGFGFAVKEEILPNYFLIATDDISELGLAYHEETDEDVYGTLVDATVIAVGFNDKYIIVKQKPQQMVWGGNKNAVNYYILPIKKGMNWKTKNGMFGPLSLNEFEAKRKELNILNLTFSKKIEDFR